MVVLARSCRVRQEARQSFRCPLSHIELFVGAARTNHSGSRGSTHLEAGRVRYLLPTLGKHGAVRLLVGRGLIHRTSVKGAPTVPIDQITVPLLMASVVSGLHLGALGLVTWFPYLTRRQREHLLFVTAAPVAGPIVVIVLCAGRSLQVSASISQVQHFLQRPAPPGTRDGRISHRPSPARRDSEYRPSSAAVPGLRRGNAGDERWVGVSGMRMDRDEPHREGFSPALGSS